VSNLELRKYEVVLDNKYYLREVLESISIDDALDQIAMQAQVRIVVTPGFPGITPGQEIRISGPFLAARKWFTSFTLALSGKPTAKVRA
jgi:hypothetical protein